MLLKLVIKFVFVVIVLYAAMYPVLNLFVCNSTQKAPTPDKTVDAGIDTSSKTASGLKAKPTTNTENVAIKTNIDKTITAQTTTAQIAVAKRKPLPDFSTYVDVKQKKVAFFSYLAPHVAQINAELAQQRQFILGLEQYPTHTKDVTRLVNMAKAFKVDDSLEFTELKQLLLLRVDQLPIELVLMQAANESAWGTSRFALTANNLFGQWCFSKGCGIVPSGRPAGEKYEVKKFKHPVDSIRSYYRNLNTGYAYKDLRELRFNLRKKNKKLDPNVIADGLLSYSTRREAYIDELKSMIRINRKYIKVN